MSDNSTDAVKNQATPQGGVFTHPIKAFEATIPKPHSSIFPVTKWLAFYQRKLESGDRLHWGDAWRLRELLHSADVVEDTAGEGYRNGSDADLVAWCSFIKALPMLILAAGKHVNVDMTPVVRLFQMQLLGGMPSEATKDDWLRNFADAETAWLLLEVSMPPIPQEEVRQQSTEQAIVELNRKYPKVSEDVATNPASNGRKGVSLRDVALFINEGDADGVSDIVKRWVDAKAIKATSLGKCPTDGRAALYELSELLSDAADFYGLLRNKKNKLETHLRALLRPASDKE